MEGDFFPVGSIVRAHGLEGALVVSPEIAVPAELESISIFYIQNDRGDFEPFRIEHAHLIYKKSRYSFFVKFVQLSSRSQAEPLQGAEIFVSAFDAESLTPFPFSWSDCEEWQVIDSDNVALGYVEEVFSSPAHDLLVIHSESHGKVFVPAVEAYVTEVHEEEQVLVVKDFEILAQL